MSFQRSPPVQAGQSLISTAANRCHFVRISCGAARLCGEMTASGGYHILSFQPKTKPMPKHQRAATPGFSRAYSLR
jgi:hypothetical protein